LISAFMITRNVFLVIINAEIRCAKLGGQHESLYTEIRPRGRDGRDADPPRVHSLPGTRDVGRDTQFIEDTTFGAHLAVMFPPGAPTSSLQPWARKGNTWMTGPLSSMR
jgi:hypothetical protein